MKKIFFSLIIIFNSFSIFPQDISEYLSDGEYFYDNQYYKKAIDSYTKVLDIESQNFEALIGRGNTYLEINQIDSSKIDFEKAVKFYPENDLSYYNLGRYFHTVNNFDSALLNYHKALNINNLSSLYNLAISQIYKEQNNQDSTFKYLNKAIELQPDYSEAYYYRGYYFYELGYPDEAYEDIEKGLEISPNDIYLLTLKAYLQSFDENYTEALETCNSILFENPFFIPALEIRAEAFFILDKMEEAISDAEFVYLQDTTNIRALIILSWANYYSENYEEALKFSQKGKVIDSENLEFYSLSGLSAFYLKKYSIAIEQFDYLLNFSPEKMDIYDYKTQAILMNNTSENVFSEYMLFSEINQNNLEELDIWVNDENGKYYFQKLLEKFENDNTSLSIDEYFMLYYGQSAQKEYAPYSKTAQKKIITDEFSIGKYEETIKLAKEMLENDPFLIDLYQYIAYSYLYLKDYENYEKYMLPYHGFMSGILATGKGENYENAFIVCSISDEYSLLYFLGLFSVEQSLFELKKNFYDVLQTKDYFENQQEIYFNITKPYNSLSKRKKIFKKRKK